MRFNFVVAAYLIVRFTPQFLRALHLELFTKPSEFSFCNFPCGLADFSKGQTVTIPSFPVMSLKNLLSKKKNAVVAKWFERVLETYPLEMQGFFRQQGDRFANPVGSTIFAGLEGLFAELLGKGDHEKTRCFLDSILRIRAIQNFSPSQAVVFLPLLKGVLKEEIGEEVRQNRLHEDWLELESRIDDFLLLAFDIYVECREKIDQLRNQERRNRETFAPPRSDS